MIEAAEQPAAQAVHALLMLETDYRSSKLNPYAWANPGHDNKGDRHNEPDTRVHDWGCAQAAQRVFDCPHEPVGSAVETRSISVTRGAR